MNPWFEPGINPSARGRRTHLKTVVRHYQKVPSLWKAVFLFGLGEALRPGDLKLQAPLGYQSLKQCWVQERSWRRP